MQEEDEDFIPKQLAIILEVSSDLANNKKLQNSKDLIHDFCIRQYSQKAFNLVIELNKRILKNTNISRHDIIPAIIEMYKNGWNIGEAYDNSKYLDELKKNYSRDIILKLLDNIL